MCERQYHPIFLFAERNIPISFFVPYNFQDEVGFDCQFLLLLLLP